MNLLFIGGPSDCLPALGKAYALKYGIFLVDGSETAPGFLWAKKWGLGAEVADVYDFHWIHKTVLKNNWQVDGVIAVGTDVGPVCSLVSKAIGCFSIPYGITHLSWDKPALKKVLNSAGIQTPSTADIVIKPVDGRGSRGVSVVSASNLWGVEWAEAKRNSPTGRVMCEEWIGGDGVSAEAIVWDSEIIFVGGTDRIYSKSLTVEEGGRGPSQFDGPWLKELTYRVAQAVQLKRGSLKMDIVLRDGDVTRPVILESAIGRLGGGYNFDYLEKSYGVNFLEMAFATYCGQDPRPLIRIGKGCFVAGRYEMNGNLTSNKERGAFRMVTGKTREEAERKLVK